MWPNRPRRPRGHSSCSPPWTAPMPASPGRRFVTLVVMLLGVAACSGTDTSSQGTQANQPPTGRPATEESDVTPIRITVDGRPITAQLADNPTAQDLAGQLPVTLTFRD